MTYLLRLSLAISLLTTERIPSEREFAFVSIDLLVIGIQLEVIGANETLSERHDIPSQLHHLRSNLRDLANAPPMASVNIFSHIDRNTISVMMKLNRDYQEHLQVRQHLYPGSTSISQAMNDAKELHRAWDALDDATRTTFGLAWKRRGLMRLREIIGQEAFDRGYMPSPLPQWALEVIR